MSHIFKVKGIWHMNDIKIIQITWLLHVNWFLQNLYINLQFAQNNSFIVQNSNTTANKEKKLQDLNFQSLWMFQKMIKDLSKFEMLTWLKSSNGVFPQQQKRTCNSVTRFQGWRNLTYEWHRTYLNNMIITC